ncbi:polyprenyl synthetase family protein [Diaminobutyricimonas sp. LJ205]|uniref:polyprenyl synthetase family protein n=1 Tax=Diaminobutyricimonas sp. LJ205 TaxID=2683590 RepID=UPI0012F4FF16|nr:polyprenyl synthetase family protein [Diaminobutyricimonas sp. LJ205]
MTALLSKTDGVEGGSAVAVRLQEFFDERIERAARHRPSFRRLWETARDASVGGKKLRPLLVLGVYRALGGTDADLAVRVAGAFELLHTALLMHDDVIDRDLVRRGSPNLAGVFATDAVDRGVQPQRATVWGEASAILAGDLLLHAAQRVIAELPGDAAVRSALLDVFDHAVFDAAAGQHADVAYATGIVQPSPADIVTMSANKTASYSFIAPIVAGAILARTDARTIDTLRSIGADLGTVFQLRDDMLGVFGDERMTGKSTLGDLREGKQTLLIAYARTTDAWAIIEPRFGRPDLTDEDAALVRAALVDFGANVFVESVIAARTAQAIETLDHAGLPGELDGLLRRVLTRCVEREA